ncbi:DUF2934 domain-containing protein [Pseudomonas mangiferae]|uniref:DUF2934 domain-containing protein n=1 Tax=Pseudomonas mangiferae TaxID=2593654 RepID=A0A553H0M0_9PSED|nr:DUF2934 domain-containing protein [Pseudomonas mangiferae]
MAHSSEDIRERAYRLWEAEGKPASEHLHHWEKALGLLADEARLASSIEKLTKDPTFKGRIAALLEAGLSTIPRARKEPDAGVLAHSAVVVPRRTGEPQ